MIHKTGIEDTLFYSRKKIVNLHSLNFESALSFAFLVLIIVSSYNAFSETFDDQLKNSKQISLEAPAVEAPAVETPAVEAPAAETFSNVIFEIKDIYFFIFFSLFVFAILALIFVTYLLYLQIKWRRKYSRTDSIVFGDAHLDFLENLKKWIKNTSADINENQNLSVNFQKETLDSLQKINSYISSQASELDRYKEGYDFAIKKNVLLSLISINEAVKASENIDIDYLNKIRRFVLSHLENHDVEEFTYDSGQSFRDLSANEFEIFDTKIVKDHNLNETIHQTVECGYYFHFEGGKQVLKKAKIIIYKVEE